MRHEGRLAFRRNLRTAATTAERILWAALRRRQLHGFKFRRQHPVGHYVLDFYCVQRKLAIEVDGASHLIGEGPDRDEDRTRFLAREGMRVLRFTNNEVKEELEGVVQVVVGALTPP
jgi:very-short-patch-repair endonuclease